MNPYSVKVDAFEGPLDLLLHLINHEELDIYDIPVARITDQYLQYIHTMKILELDIASEYLVMAATLLAIKSKMLLPKESMELFDEEWAIEEEEDPREELMFQLIEYRKYKEAALELQEKEQERSLIHTKPPEDLDPYVTEQERRELAIQGVSLFDMLSAYQKLMKRKAFSTPRTRTIKSQEYSIEEKMDEVMTRLLSSKGPQRFNVFFESGEKSQLVVTFLAVLELMKTNVIRCEQDDHFADIMIYQADGGVLA
ncbi:segregation/condensation protein A [Alkalicoccobacillus murimartini]|uniref:Segregation and condensation protein A n=1 Tax=Alkalicoccobacillus murimartini TaxID=171685 RepID=A0ABT9YDY4_9BACI|nr:segregation/condensation protein A [Alkalicoccobacillus murimartini]MDQ0205843.1 segregation and condensation protein A [Alkalicoccobacillus murimartini]